MKIKVQSIPRMILGLIYFVFGLMGLIFASKMTPPPMPEAATAFMKGMMSAVYFLPVLKLTEIIGGFLILTGIAAPFGLIILAPVTLQIFLFHTFLTPGIKEAVLPSIMVLLHVIAIFNYWKVYRQLFSRG